MASGGDPTARRKLPPPRPGPPRRGPTRSLPRPKSGEPIPPPTAGSGPPPATAGVPSPTPAGVPASTPFDKPKPRELDALIADELAAVMKSFNVDQTLGADMTLAAGTASPATPLRRGQAIEGRIVAVHPPDVFVEIPGQRDQGVLPSAQFDEAPPRPGMTVSCTIEGYDAANGLWLLSRRGAARIVTDWSQLQPHAIVEARVTGVNKQRTGLLVEVHGIRGFLPASQIDLHRVEDLEAYLQQRLKVEVLEASPAEQKLVVSRRAVLERERQEQAEKFWSGIEEGHILRGTVRNIKSFGVFVDLGGVDGLIPASELAWQRVDNLEEIVRVGQEVEVAVIRQDREARKVTLSLKRVHGDPWAEFAARVRPGSRLNAVITRLAEFGAFAEVEPGIEGLIHITELAPHRVRRVSDVVQAGQRVDVEVLAVDRDNHRLSLSLRAVVQKQQEAEQAAAAAELAADLREAEQRLARRKPSRPGLRGGIGSEPLPPVEE